MKDRKIAELTTYTSRLNGGVFYALTALLPRLAHGGGFDARVFGYADRHTEDDRGAWAPLAVEAYAPWPPRHFGFSPSFLPGLRRFQPALLHAHGLWTYLSYASLRVHQQTGAPLVISPHGMLDPWALQFSPLKKQLVAACFQSAQLRSAAVFHALTVAEAAAIRRYGLENPIVVIPNGVVLPPAPASPPSPLAVRRTRTLLFLSRVHPKKGLEPLIEAWSRFSGARLGEQGWRLIIAGWDEIGYEPRLRDMVNRSGVSQSITFVGPLFGEAKQRALAEADAFVLSSLSEGLPMSVLEAWAAGKPVLISPECNLPEGVAAGAAIEAAPVASSILEGLERLAALSDRERAAMGAAGRALVAERFDWDRIAAHFVRLYRAVLSGQEPPSDLLYRG